MFRVDTCSLKEDLIRNSLLGQTHRQKRLSNLFEQTIRIDDMLINDVESGEKKELTSNLSIDSHRGRRRSSVIKKMQSNRHSTNSFDTLQVKKVESITSP